MKKGCEIRHGRMVPLWISVGFSISLDKIKSNSVTVSGLTSDSLFPISFFKLFSLRTFQKWPWSSPNLLFYDQGLIFTRGKKYLQRKYKRNSPFRLRRRMLHSMVVRN
jgi:hypothetical protein